MPRRFAAFLLPLTFAAGAFAAAPEGSVPDADGWLLLFNGRDLDGWKFRNENQAKNWTCFDNAALDPENPAKLVGQTVAGKPNPIHLRTLLCKAPSSDLFTEHEFGDYELHIEFMVPKGSNSGVYNRGLWEIQILDSFGKKTIGMGDCGALYGRRIASENAAVAPGQWQTFDIKLKGYEITVTWNGVKVHENYDVRWTELTAAEHEKLLADRKAAEGGALAPAKAAADEARAAYEKLKADKDAAKADLDKAKAAADKTGSTYRHLNDAATAKLEERAGKFYKWAGEGPTTSGVGRKDTTKGPILLQGDHGDVAFRNIKIRELKP